MMNIDDQQIDKLLEDIASIKAVINRNRTLIQQILLPRHFRLFSLVAGISILIFSFLFYFLMEHFGNYGSIPGNVKTILFGAMILDWMLLVFLKYSRWGASLLKINRSYTLSRALEEFFSYRIIHTYLPLTGVMIILCVFLADIDAYYMIPAIAIGSGLLYNFIGSITEIRQWLVTGYWFLITGVATLFLNSIPSMIALAITMGCGCLLFAIVPSREV